MELNIQDIIVWSWFRNLKYCLWVIVWDVIYFENPTQPKLKDLLSTLILGYWPSNIWINKYMYVSIIIWFFCLFSYVMYKLWLILRNQPMIENLFLLPILGSWLLNIWIGEYMFMWFACVWNIFLKRCMSFVNVRIMLFAYPNLKSLFSLILK